MTPSTSRLGQDTTAALSSSSTPGWTATWSCQAVSNWSSASTESGTGAIKRASGSDNDGNQGSALGAESRPAGTVMSCIGDAGSAARFFYSAKAGSDDRFGSRHPTVKPVNLMRWLCRLVTPPGGTVLDCFAGSGTTGAAAIAERFDCVLIERDAASVEDIRLRIDHLEGRGKHSGSVKYRNKKPDLGPLFKDLP